MEIINIITCSLNTVDSVKSFVITDQEKRQAVVEQAEKEFEKIIREMGYDEDDDISMDAVLDNGYYQSKVNGQQSVCLSWSHKIEREKTKKFVLIHEHKYGSDTFLFQMETKLTADDLTQEHSEEICELLEIDFDEDRDVGTITEINGKFKTIKLK
jgi:hypothetical protein